MSYPVKLVKVITPIALAISLAACGGGSSFGGAGAKGGDIDINGEAINQDVDQQENAEVADLDIRPSSLRLVLDGTKPITIDVIPKDTLSNAITAKTTFSTTDNATLVVSGSSVTVTPDDAIVGDIIRIKIKSGNIEETIDLLVIDEEADTQNGETVTAVDIRADSSQLLSDGSKAVTITAISKNSDNNVISAGVKFSTAGAATLKVKGSTATLTSDGAAPGSVIIVEVIAGDLPAEELFFTVVDVEQAPILHIEPISIGISHLPAGGSTGITVELKDQNNNYAKIEETAYFTSKCISERSSEVESAINSSSGIFTTTYTAIGCDGDDELTVTIGSLKQTAIITVDPANIGAVEFVSAEPKNILLKGMSAEGRQHTSTVRFLIKNDVGGPLRDADVTFELVTPSAGDGGVSLSTLQTKTDIDGYAETILRAGTVHTSVRVRATVVRDGSTISSESSSLIISTGIADQNSLSLSLETLNARAWNHDGIIVKANIYAADRYNNPVPDGTTVSFYTELGQIEPECKTVKGACTALWKSSNPKVLGLSDPRYVDDGISTITAKIIGEESFSDSNANGIFDDGDAFDEQSDRGEAYADYNMNYNDNHIAGNHFDDLGVDRFILDYNGNGLYDVKDGHYTGLGCKHISKCEVGGNGLKDIFVSAELVLSEETQAIKIVRARDGVVVVDSLNGISKTLVNNVSYIIDVFGPRNKQVPPVNTTISASSEAAKVIAGSAKVPNTNAHNSDINNPYGAFSLPLYLEADEKPFGTVKIAINTGGLETVYVVGYENDNDGDLIPNSQDPDDDNDGINDADELASGTNRYVYDSPFIDTDGDGISDFTESNATLFVITDTNNNGVSDVNEIDTDSDGLPDDTDLDDDGDGVSDINDAFPLDGTESVDTDGDGIGNNADDDDDADGILDTVDPRPLDTDNDGINNVDDFDDDNDGAFDVLDAFPLDSAETLDTDKDGIGNNADLDDDGDGIPDTHDVFPLDDTESVDTDGDGVGDNADNFPNDPLQQ